MLAAGTDNSPSLKICRESASSGLQNYRLGKITAKSREHSAAGQRTAEGQLVGELQVAAHWQA